MHPVILGLLLSGPLSLYDVQKRFSAGLSHFYSASSGSIERALRRIVEAGDASIHAEPGSARGRKLYRITDAGRIAWREWMHAPTPSGSDAETTALAKVFLLGRLESSDEQRDVLTRIRAEVEASHETLLSVARTVDIQAADLDAAARRLFEPQRATLDYGLRAHDTLRAWLVELEEAYS